MKAIFLLVSITILGLSSCTSTATKTLKNIAKLETVQKKEQVVEKKLSSSSRIYIDGALTALKKQPAKHVTQQTKLAIRLLENAQEIEGIPEHALRLDVDLLTKPTIDKSENDKLLKLEAEHRTAISERIALEEQLKDLQAQIVKDAEKLATVANKSWLDRIKESIYNYIALLVLLLCLILFGPKLLKFLLRRS